MRFYYPSKYGRIPNKLKLQFTKKNFFHQNNMILHRVPFNWRTPYGYLIVHFSTLQITYYIFMESTFNLSLAIGICCFMAASANDIKAKINEIHSSNAQNEESTEFYKKVCGILKFHMTMKQLSVHSTYNLNFK